MLNFGRYYEIAKKDSPLKEGWTDCSQDGVFAKYRKLPYNPKLKDRAKLLRKAGVLSEILLWDTIKEGKLLNLHFYRKKIIGNYIVDFFCPELELVIETDGVSHEFKDKYDFDREKYLKSLGLRVIHFDDRRIKKELDKVKTELEKYCLYLMNTNH